MSIALDMKPTGTTSRPAGHERRPTPLTEKVNLGVVKIPNGIAGSWQLAAILSLLPSKVQDWVLVAGQDLGAGLSEHQLETYAVSLQRKGCVCVIAEGIAPAFEHRLKQSCIFPLTLHSRCSARLISFDDTISLKENKDLFSSNELTRSLVLHRPVWICVGRGRSLFANHSLTKADVARFMQRLSSAV